MWTWRFTTTERTVTSPWCRFRLYKYIHTLVHELCFWWRGAPWLVASEKNTIELFKTSTTATFLELITLVISKLNLTKTKTSVKRNHEISRAESFSLLFFRYMTVPPGLSYVNFEKKTDSRKDVPILCSAPSPSTNNTIKCDIGNPVSTTIIIRLENNSSARRERKREI